MNKKVILASVAGSAILISAIFVTSAYASNFGKGRNYSPERHEQMTKAFENKEYNAWKETMGDRPMASKINEQNFGKFSQMHNLMQEGKYEEAAKIRQELGFGNGKSGQGMRGNGQGMMNGQRGQNRNGNFVDQNNDGICDHRQ